MNNVRVNNAQENGLMQIRHSAAWYLYILWIVLPALMWISCLVFAIIDYFIFYYFLIGLVLMSGVLVIGILEIIFINKRDFCQLTDKRLIVFVKHCFSHKHLTYRLDQLNDVEIHSCLGVKGIVLRVTQGNNQDKKIALRYVRDARNIYNYLCGLLTTQKNNTDTFCELFNK